MRKFIQWLAKVFNANITIEKVAEKEIIKEVIKEVCIGNTIDGDVTISGNVVVNGNLIVDGEVIVNGYLSSKSVVNKKLNKKSK